MNDLRVWGAVSVALACVACATEPVSPPTQVVGPRAEARLESRSGSSTEGVVRFRPVAGGLVAEVDIRGLAPNAEHGFHVHEKGDCSAPDAASAGGHFNPTNQPHGRRDGGTGHHAGDIPNLRADATGAVRTEIEVPGLTIVGGPTSVVGRALVVHRDPDDYTSQPAGNSGPRIACGVIVAK